MWSLLLGNFAKLFWRGRFAGYKSTLSIISNVRSSGQVKQTIPSLPKQILPLRLCSVLYVRAIHIIHHPLLKPSTEGRKIHIQTKKCFACAKPYFPPHSLIACFLAVLCSMVIGPVAGAGPQNVKKAGRRRRSSVGSTHSFFFGICSPPLPSHRSPGVTLTVFCQRPPCPCREIANVSARYFDLVALVALLRPSVLYFVNINISLSYSFSFFFKKDLEDARVSCPRQDFWCISKQP